MNPDVKKNQLDEEEWEFWGERAAPSIKEHVQEFFAAAAAAGFDMPQKKQNRMSMNVKVYVKILSYIFLKI